MAKKKKKRAPARPLSRLSHVRPAAGGPESCMVDVGAKPISARSALARAEMRFPPGALATALGGRAPKGPILELARAAGVLGAKRTADLIPMCHPLGLDHVEVRFRRMGKDRLEILCRASCRGRTGVEMEALCGASLAALCVYDMTKALGRGIRIERLELVSKTKGDAGPDR